MKLIYRAGDISEAHIIAGLLETHEINTHVGGHYLQGGVGDLAAMNFATLHVADEDTERALSIIADYEKNTSTPVNSEQKQSSIFTSPFFILAMSILMMLILSITLNDQ